jgi:hypothetical protein
MEQLNKDSIRLCSNMSETESLNHRQDIKYAEEQKKKQN